ncbi:MAG: hypothetical protein HY451_01935 [Parcubacteria group bacterium]|nr:hypothetical protein [Parcubacteria group bacterium]
MWNIILKPQSERHQGWQAFLHGSPNIKGVGRTKEEAVAALWNQVAGKLILENPAPFGMTVTLPK